MNKPKPPEHGAFDVTEDELSHWGIFADEVKRYWIPDDCGAVFDPETFEHVTVYREHMVLAADHDRLRAQDREFIGRLGGWVVLNAVHPDECASYLRREDGEIVGWNNGLCDCGLCGLIAEWEKRNETA